MRTDGFFDDISITLHKIYDTIYSDQDYCTVSEDSIRLSLDTISRVLETINTGDPNLECSEEEKDIITAFIDTIAQTTSNELIKYIKENNLSPVPLRFVLIVLYSRMANLPSFSFDI